MLNGLDLFSGIGGITLALSEWVKPVAYCENDRYAQSVLLSRMSEGKLPVAPIWDDVRTLQGSLLPKVDIIYGGFPCQDVSLAGARKGLDGERTGLFREAVRLIRECRPKFVFLENVQGIKKFVPKIRSELEKIGYDCRDGFLSAAEVGANHKRNRWWLLAYSDHNRHGFSVQQKCISRIVDEADSWSNGKVQSLADADSAWQLQQERSQQKQWKRISDGNWWAFEPNVGRLAHGIPFRLDRIRGLGNAVVPQCAEEAFKRLLQGHR